MLKILRYHRLLIAKTLLIVMGLNTFSSVVVAATAAPVPFEEQKVRGVYDELALLHLPSLAKLDVQEKHDIAELNKKNKDLASQEQKTFTIFKKSKAQKLKDVQDQELKSVESLRLIYNTFQETDTQELSASSTYLQKNVCNDLTLFYGDKVDPMHHLFSFLDNTETISGKIELQKMLYEPTSDINELVRRQNVVKELLSNEQLFNDLAAKVQVIKDVEKQVLWFCRQQDEPIAEYYDIPYIQSGFLKGYNDSEAGLELVNRQRTVLSPAYFVASPFISHMLFWYIQSKFFGDKRTYTEFFKDTCKLVKTIAKETFMGEHSHKIPAGVRVAVFAAASLGLYGYYKGVSTAVETAGINNKITNQIQEKLISTATLTKTINDLGNIVFKNDILKQGLSSVGKLQGAFTGVSKKAKLSELLQNFSTSTFTGEAGFFSMRGKVLNSYNLMQKESSNVIDLMKFGGQIDAYLSITKLYKKLAANSNAQYCFVDYVSASAPAINLVDFWHPMLDPNNVVKNSASLSGQDGMAQNMIVTGPNAGGKSTALKGITIAVVLAQTIGIAPASQMSLTPFALINTYLNVTDTIGRESLFQAELNRAKKLINSIAGLNANQFSFVILDEIFTGTNPEEGKEGSRQVINLLNRQKNNIAIIATHYHDLTDLETLTKGHIKNYKVSIARENGLIKYLYKLEPGISDQKIALELVGQALSGYNTAL